MFKVTLFSRLFLLVMLCAPASFSQNILDFTFNATPSVKLTMFDKGQVVQSDGKIIVWGGNLNADSLVKGQLARLNTDGTVDPTFNYCNCHFGEISNVLLQSDGKLIISDDAGNSHPLSSRTAVRLNPDGSEDTSFNKPVFPSDSVAVKIQHIQPDGKLIFEELIYSATTSGRRIGRYNSDGTIDASFNKIVFDNGTSGGMYFMDLKVAPDGKIYFAYRSTNFGQFKRYNPDGTPDNTFVGGNTPWPNRIAFQPDGKILVSGAFTSVNGFATTRLVRLLPTGAVDTTFAASGFLGIGNIRYLSSGKILVDGSRVSSSQGIFRLNSDGSLDTSRPGALITEGTGLFDKGILETGDIKVNENSSLVSNTAFASIRNDFDLDPLERPVFFGQPTGGPMQFYRLDNSGNIDNGFTPKLGHFATTGSVVLQPDGKILVSGAYELMNGVSRNSISRINANGSIDTSFDPGTGIPINPNVSPQIKVLPDGKMFVNHVNRYNDAFVDVLIRVNANGTLDTSFSPPVTNGGIIDFAPQPDGKVIIGGNFTTLHGSPRNYLARLNSDGSLDTSFNVNLGNPQTGFYSVLSIAIQSDGKILIGGVFFSVNGFPASGLIRLNSDSTLDQSYQGGGGAGLILIQPDGKVLIHGGDLLRRLNSDGSTDPAFSSKLVSRVRTMALRANGDIFLGGEFDQIEGVRRKNFAWLNSAGRLENGSFLPGADKPIDSIVVQPDNKVLIAGQFTKFNGVARSGLARINATNFTLRTKFDFDGDGRSDISVFRPSDGNWYLAQSTNGFAVNHFGQNGDRAVPSDYDGDGKTDLAIFRDGAWWYLNSSNSTVGLQFYGGPGDVPLRGDLDGDNKDDFVVYRPSTVQWFLRLSAYSVSGYPYDITFQWGSGGDIPFLEDFNGEGRSWIGFYRPTEGKFYFTNDGSDPTNFATFQWGMNGDVPVLGDYDGDGRTDYAVWRPSNGAWYICYARDNSIAIFTWGLAGDKPVVGDYDGDGRSDIAVWRPSNGVWYIMGSTVGFMGMQYGLSNDRPIPASYMP